jgi:hypothetical protein
MALEPRRRKPKAVERVEPLNDLRSGDLAPHRQCPAMSKRTGERCKRYCAPGFRTCVWHGSATKKSKMAAAKRIAKASGYAAEMLVEFMADPDVDVKLRTTIAQDLLSRANVTAKTAIELTVPEWEKRAKSAVVGAVVDWGELASMRPQADPNVIDAEVVQEDEAHEREWDRRLEAPHDPAPRQRVTEVERRIEALPPKPKRIEDDEQPPWLGTEGAAQTATRRADEHRRRAFEADKASNGLAPRATRKRK